MKLTDQQMIKLKHEISKNCARLQKSISGRDALLEKMEELISDKAQTPQYLQTFKKETINPQTLSVIGGLVR